LSTFLFEFVSFGEGITRQKFVDFRFKASSPQINSPDYDPIEKNLRENQNLLSKKNAQKWKFTLSILPLAAFIVKMPIKTHVQISKELNLKLETRSLSFRILEADSFLKSPLKKLESVLVPPLENELSIQAFQLLQTLFSLS